MCVCAYYGCRMASFCGVCMSIKVTIVLTHSMCMKIVAIINVCACSHNKCVYAYRSYDNSIHDSDNSDNSTNHNDNDACNNIDNDNNNNNTQIPNTLRNV